MNKEVDMAIRDALNKLALIHSESIPNIDLYMDQVTTFMDSQLGQLKRTPEEKILTKTMINNYAKNRLLPAPEKKKYTKEHVIMLTFIYYFKNFLSISDIGTLLNSMAKKYFNQTGGLNMTGIYDEICGHADQLNESLRDDLKSAYESSCSSFSQLPEGEERDSLQLFTLICLLGFDVYTKKLIIENLIDRSFAQDFPKSNGREEAEAGSGKEKEGATDQSDDAGV